MGNGLAPNRQQTIAWTCVFQLHHSNPQAIVVILIPYNSSLDLLAFNDKNLDYNIKYTSKSYQKCYLIYMIMFIHGANFEEYRCDANTLAFVLFLKFRGKCIFDILNLSLNIHPFIHNRIENPSSIDIILYWVASYPTFPWFIRIIKIWHFIWLREFGL